MAEIGFPPSLLSYLTNDCKKIYKPSNSNFANFNIRYKQKLFPLNLISEKRVFKRNKNFWKRKKLLSYQKYYLQKTDVLFFNNQLQLYYNSLLK